MKQLIQTNKKQQPTILKRFISKPLKSGLFLLLFSFLINAVQAQYIFTATASTNWNLTSTWIRTGTGGLNLIPAATDSVIIEGILIVTIPDGIAAVCRGLVIGVGSTVTSYGNLTFAGTSSLTVTNAISFNNTFAGMSPSKLTRSSINPVLTSTITCGSIDETAGGTALLTTQTGTMAFTGSFTAPAKLFQFENLIISSGTTTFSSVAPEIIGNLSVSNAAVLDLGTVGASNTLGIGTLTLSSGSTLKLGGILSYPAGFSTHSIAAASNIEYYGTNQNILPLISSQNYGNLIISGSGFKTLTTSIGIAGNLTLNSTSTLRTSNISGTTNTLNRVSSGGILTINNGATLRITGTGTLPSNFLTHSIGNSSTIEYSGTYGQTISALNSGQSYGNLNVDSQVKTMAGDITVAGTLTITSGSLVIANNTLSLGGAVSMGLNNYLTGSTGSNLILTGAFNRYIYFDSTTPGTTNMLNNLTLNHVGNTTYLGNNLVTNGTLIFTAGKLAINGTLLTLKSNVTNTVSGGLSSSSTSNLVVSGGVYNPTLSFDQTTPGTTNVINNVTVNTIAKTVTLSNALRLLGTHTPTNGVFAAGGNYTIASTLSKTANIAAGAAAGDYITGNVIVERFIPQNTYRAWRLLAAPANGKTINETWQEAQGAAVNGKPGFGTNITSNLTAWATTGFDYKTQGNSLLYYDQANNTLPGITNTSDQISNHPGYFIYIRGNRSITPDSVTVNNNSSTTLRTTGTLNTGNQSAITIPADKSAVIGNPYAAALDVRTFGVTGGCIGASFYVWDPKLAGSYNLGAYQTLTDGGSGNFIVVPGGGSYGANGSTQNTIESGAAFFTRAIGSSGTITINEASKTTGSRMVFKPAAASPGETLVTNLFAKNNNVFTMADGNLVMFDPSNNDAIDAFDAIKRTNFGENLSILKNGISLAVDKRLPIGSTDTIFLRMYYMKKIDYRLQLVANNLQHPNLAAFLEDTYNTTSKPLNLMDTTNYDFTIDANVGSIAEKRFRIVFKPIAVLPVSVTSIKATLQSKQIAVEWKVENQINIRLYEVEKSVNGRAFIKAATLAATGINGSAVSYNWLDVNPAAAVNYYRIKSADVNGTYKYSGIVKVAIGKSVPAIKAVPNLIDGNTMNLQFISQPKGKYTIILLSNNGQAVFSVQQTHNGGNDLQTVNLPASTPNGAYQLEIIAPDNSRKLQKLIIHRNK